VPSFRIPVTWEVYGVTEIEARTIAQAIDTIMDQGVEEYPKIDGHVEDSITVTDYDLTLVLNKNKKADEY
jgi:hypothetical protein